jgi:hypothetical protein
VAIARQPADEERTEALQIERGLLVFLIVWTMDESG